MSKKKPDRRTARTRSALVSALAWLMHTGQRFEAIRIGEIIERANVGRSTFYEHFKNKDEVLAATFEIVLIALSGTVDEKQDVAILVELLEHGWSEREISRSLFGSTNRRAMIKALRRFLLQRLQSLRPAPARSNQNMLRIASIALAEAQLAAINAWVSGEVFCTATELAELLTQLARSFTLRRR